MTKVQDEQNHVRKKPAGFTKLPHGFHTRLSDLKGADLSVWIAHRSMESKDGESFPSLDNLADYTGYDRTTVKNARKRLRVKGWLVTTGQRAAKKGRFTVPIERTSIPTVDVKHTHGESAAEDAKDSKLVRAGVL